MIYHIYLKWNFEDKISENKVKNEVFIKIKIEFTDYKRD